MLFKGHGTIWDGEHNKPLCSFSDGKLETVDLRIATKLIDMGYEYEGNISELKQEVPEEAENSQEKKTTSKRGRKND